MRSLAGSVGAAAVTQRPPQGDEQHEETGAHDGMEWELEATNLRAEQ